MFERFMVAHSRFMLGSQQHLDREEPRLHLFSHRRAGTTILAQTVLNADDGGVFPPTGPVRLNISQIAERAAVSRALVRQVLRAGEEAGFLTLAPDGTTTFSQKMRDHVDWLVIMYWIIQAYSAEQALGGREPTYVQLDPAL